MDLKLKGKKALVMGSSTGIGRAIAQSLINEGVEVAICSRTKEAIEKTAKEIAASCAFVCDLTQRGEAASVVLKTLDGLGGLDILVTNTGGPPKGNLLEVSDRQWDIDFQALWMSVVESMRICIPSMQKNNYGRILMITSIAAKESLQGLTTSNGLRAGLCGLAKTGCNEYAKDGITFNLLLPGYTNTDRLKVLNLSEEKVNEMIPAGRLANPCELADLCCFLASPKAGYINGQSIAVDGGALRSH